MKRALSLIVLTCAIAGFAQSAPAATFYAPEYGNDRVQTFDVGSGGALTPLAGSPFAIPDGGLRAFVTTPDGSKGVAGYLFNAGIRGVSIGGDGSITPSQAKINMGDNDINDLAVTPDSRFAYAATRDYPMGNVAGIRAYSFAANGAVTELVGSPYSTEYEFMDVAVTPDQRFLYGTIGMGLVAFAINPNGTLTLIGNTGAVAASWVSTSTDGRFVFVGNDSGGGSPLYSFAVQSDGNLSQVGEPVIAPGASANAQAVAPNGRFIYFPENNDDVVLTIRINPDGTLTQVGTTPIQQAESIVVSPDSKRLYMHVSEGGDKLVVSSIGADGVPGPPQEIAAYDSSTPVRLHFRTGYGGVASFTATPEEEPFTVKFDGSKSTAKQDALGDLDWTIDGIAATGAVQTRTFPKSGVYDVSLVARDAGGCGSERAWLGQTAPCMGSPESTKTVRFDTPPWITSMSISPKRVGAKTKIKFKLTEKARMTFVVQKPAAGRMVGSACRKPSRANRKAKRCTRWLRASKSFRAKGKKGSNSVKFTGKVGRNALKRGRYRLAATALDSAKGKSPQRTTTFRKP